MWCRVGGGGVSQDPRTLGPSRAMGTNGHWSLLGGGGDEGIWGVLMPGPPPQAKVGGVGVGGGVSASWTSGSSQDHRGQSAMCPSWGWWVMEMGVGVSPLSRVGVGGNVGVSGGGSDAPVPGRAGRTWTPSTC